MRDCLDKTRDNGDLDKMRDNVFLVCKIKKRMSGRVMGGESTSDSRCRLHKELREKIEEETREQDEV